ncbi:unnamed protein product [Candidula unifasciata]|uniref:G-protein coupled receptors family 1 profile domain-containing protein n=1 Tax=Candidula unifasciata TaxID=100452 RepID=A0A8S3ZVS9_9EUPU|nr:unnamed protein product [Candidula unifasciata]
MDAPLNWTSSDHYGLAEVQGDQRVDFISDNTRTYLDVVFYVLVQGSISLLGSAGNILNILVFVKQGFKDTVNCSLMALSLSDLGSLVTLTWMSICYLPEFRFSGIEFESLDIQYLTACWPHGSFARITSCITAYISFERCLCTALPLKVKTIITPARTLIIMASIFLMQFSVVSLVFYSVRLGPVYYLRRNTTLVGLVYIDNGPYLENMAFSIDIGIQIFSFVIVAICTMILIQSLIRNRKWRNSATQSAVPDSVDSKTAREKRVVVMVTTISGIFIACYTPSVINLIIMLCFPDYSIVGAYSNTFILIWSLFLNLEAINSAVNIFIYYNMSSKFRTVFSMTLKSCTATAKSK